MVRGREATQDAWYLSKNANILIYYDLIVEKGIL